MRIKKGLIVIISFMLMFAAFPSPVSPNENSTSETESGEYSAKDEVVYGNLNANGNTDHMYVVNTFHVTEPGELVDYGNYTNVKNLTNLSDIQQTEDNRVHFQADKGEFYYQGELENKSLPWDISITYYLDGQEVNPEELAGQSGSFEMHISTSANENVDAQFFENYLMQISLTLDPAKFNDILAPEGTKANSGKNEQISFTALPDQEEEFIVSANVSDFEMDPINISAVPANISIEKPDLGNMTGEMQSLSDAISQVNSGVAELNSGIAELNSGTSELSNGSSEYLSGIQELSQSSEQLVNGSSEINEALSQVSESIQGNENSLDLSELEALPEGFRTLATGLQEAATGLETLKENYDQAYGTLDEAINGIPDYEITEEQIAALYETEADSEVIDQLVETYGAAVTVKETYLTVQEGFDAVTESLSEVSTPIQEMASNLETMADEIESGMENLEQMDGLSELQEGLSTFSTEYQTFHDGLVSYTEGVTSLATSYQELDTGIQNLSEGTSSLESGASELENGTQELQESTSDLPGQMESEIDEALEEFENSDFEPDSFVSDQNENVEVVQFVLQTEPIEMEEPETPDQEEEEEKGFWEKLTDLFR